MVQNKFFNKNSVKLIDKHTLAQIGPGNLMGEDDVANGNSLCSSSAKCIS